MFVGFLFCKKLTAASILLEWATMRWSNPTLKAVSAAFCHFLQKYLENILRLYPKMVCRTNGIDPGSRYALMGAGSVLFGAAPFPEGFGGGCVFGPVLRFFEVGNLNSFSSPTTMPNPNENLPDLPLPFSVDELRLLVDKLDAFVKFAALATMKKEMGPDEMAFPSTVVDELAHMYGLLSLVRCCVQEIEFYDR